MNQTMPRSCMLYRVGSYCVICCLLDRLGRALRIHHSLMRLGCLGHRHLVSFRRESVLGGVFCSRSSAGAAIAQSYCLLDRSMPSCTPLIARVHHPLEMAPAVYKNKPTNLPPRQFNACAQHVLISSIKLKT